MTEREIAAFQPLMRLAADAYINVCILNKHYVETISQLTGKDQDTINKELNDLLPEQKKKTEEFLKQLFEEYKYKGDTSNK